MLIEELESIRDKIIGEINKEMIGDDPRIKSDRTVAKLAVKALFEIAIDLKSINLALITMIDLQSHTYQNGVLVKVIKDEKQETEIADGENFYHNPED